MCTEICRHPGLSIRLFDNFIQRTRKKIIDNPFENMSWICAPVWTTVTSHYNGKVWPGILSLPSTYRIASQGVELESCFSLKWLTLPGSAEQHIHVIVICPEMFRRSSLQWTEFTAASLIITFSEFRESTNYHQKYRKHDIYQLRRR